jgi:hypothetical protein
MNGLKSPGFSRGEDVKNPEPITTAEGVDTFATHVLPLDQASHAYQIFQKKEDGAVKITLKP